MNQNLSEEKKDIKPERPDLSSNRRARKTGGGSFLFSSLVLILNSIGLIILFLWFFNTSGNQQQAGQNFVERISVLEESIAEKDQQLNTLSEEVDADLKFINKEVRKLSIVLRIDLIVHTYHLVNHSSHLTAVTEFIIVPEV